jgi:broad specificity phosphatase PhoE
VLELWLIRHAESEGNRRGDQGDTPLSARGRSQAARLGARLRGIAFDAALSSDLQRCVQTAALSLPGAGLRCEPRLRELAAGPPERFLDLARLSQDELAALLAQPPLPPSETGSAFRDRLRQWRDELPARGRVVAFTHTLVIRELLDLYGAPRSPAADEIANASVTRLTIGREVDLLAVNDTGHLSEV